MNRKTTSRAALTAMAALKGASEYQQVHTRKEHDFLGSRTSCQTSSKRSRCWSTQV